MKRKLFAILLAIFIVGIYSCSEDDAPTIDVKNETVTMDANYTSDVYYSLKDGVVAKVSRTDWDVAFSVGAMSSSIIVNEGAGVVLKEYPTTEGWNWADAIDTTGYSTWATLNNSDENWEEGAFGQNATGHPNYGWGVYNELNHNVEGVAMYILKLVNGDFKRIFVEIKDATAKEYKFKYSDLDGSNEVSKTISFAGATSNYIYYSIEDEAVVADREPDSSTWDLLFTKYIDTSINYNVTGVKQNIGVMAIESLNEIDVPDVSSEFSENITTIGSDWKEFNMGTYEYTVDATKIYFVKDKDANIYKLVFTGFAGSSTGNMTFDITKL